MKRTCPYCKEEFEAQRKDKNYCSASCRQQSYLIRKGSSLSGSEASLIQSVKTSSDVLTEQNNDVSNDTLTANQNVIEQNVIESPKVRELEYKWINSSFLDKAIDKLQRRNLDFQLRQCVRNNPNLESVILFLTSP